MKRAPGTGYLALAALVGLLTVSSACGSSPGPGSAPEETAADGGGTCPNDLPSSCPDDVAPSYAAMAQPIIASRCAICHEQGGLESAPIVLDTYQAVYDQRSAVLDQVYSCSMPPANDVGAEPLTDDERTTLLAWLVCGAPQN